MSGRGQSRLEMLQQCHLVTVLVFVWEQLVDGVLQKDKKEEKMFGFC